MPDTTTPTVPVIPELGLHVLHRFYRVNHAAWHSLSVEDQRALTARFVTAVSSIRAEEKTQLLVFSVLGDKADIGFMILSPDLQKINDFETRLTLSLGAGILKPAYSYLSMTELSEYTTTEEEYAQQTAEAENLAVDGPEMEAKLGEFRARMKKYNQDRLYPNMADWPVLCFYPMSKRRNVEQNWYSTDFETRRKMMGGHARTGRSWHGKIRQLITGSAGLDFYEWGVTLLSHSTQDIKGIVYEMRFDEVSARFADFGDFYIGLQLSPEEILRRNHVWPA